MVAINFMASWGQLILSGQKRQTIRKTAKCKAGDELQLYTDLRTSDPRLIGTATCHHVESITIADDYLANSHWRIPSGDAHNIAKRIGLSVMLPPAGPCAAGVPLRAGSTASRAPHRTGRKGCGRRH